MAHMTIDLSSIDWKLLTTQKVVLLNWIEYFKTYKDEFPELDLDVDDCEFNEVEVAEGLVEFLDNFQDQAAQVLGEDVVFPNLGADGLSDDEMEDLRDVRDSWHRP